MLGVGRHMVRSLTPMHLLRPSLRMRVAVYWGKLALLLTLMMIAVAASSSEKGETSRALYADLAIQFVCPEQRTSEVENAIERFLQEEGFKTLNKARIQRQHGAALSELRIVAIDGRQRMMDFLALPHSKGRYAVKLNTPPPTKRSFDLERNIEVFVSTKLRCELRQITRSENGHNAADLFQAELKRVRNLFREADELNEKRRI